MSRKLWWSRRKKDFRVDWFSGTGGGGQYRNKHPNCCRLVDKETGITTTGQEHRERPANLKSAFHKMVEKLKEYYSTLLNSDTCTRSQTASFGKATRSYDLEGDRVTDHVTGKKYSYRHTVGKGDIGQLIEDRKRFVDQERIKDGTR